MDMLQVLKEVLSRDFESLKIILILILLFREIPMKDPLAQVSDTKT